MAMFNSDISHYQRVSCGHVHAMLPWLGWKKYASGPHMVDAYPKDLTV